MFGCRLHRKTPQNKYDLSLGLKDGVFCERIVSAGRLFPRDEATPNKTRSPGLVLVMEAGSRLSLD